MNRRGILKTSMLRIASFGGPCMINLSEDKVKLQGPINPAVPWNREFLNRLSISQLCTNNTETCVSFIT
jgi:hypothetical protein